MTVRMISVGMSALDTIYSVPEIPSSPVKILASGYTECGGGMAANAAVAAARLGAAVEYWGRVGDDLLGQRIIDELATEGVEVAYVRRVTGCASPCAAVLVDPHGERLICAYNDPLLDRDPAWLPLARVAAVDVVLADVRWPEGSAAALDRARADRKIAVLDGEVGPVPDILALVPRATHVAFSTAGLATAFPAAGPGASLHLAAMHTDAVVGVTMGAQGFLWLEGTLERHVPALAIDAVDTLAAGDVWHAAFGVALAERLDVGDAARFANVAAAIKCERRGGRRGAPSGADVVDRLKTTIKSVS
jgi:sulfofructose kinase